MSNLFVYTLLYVHFVTGTVNHNRANLVNVVSAHPTEASCEAERVAVGPYFDTHNGSGVLTCLRTSYMTYPQLPKMTPNGHVQMGHGS